MSAVGRLPLRGAGPGRQSYAVLRVTERASARGFAGPGAGAGRFVRVVLTGAAGERVVDEHLRAGLHAPLRGRRLADVLIGCGTDGPRLGDACAVCTERGSAMGHPGALVVAVPRGTECLLRCGAAGGAPGSTVPYVCGTGALLTLGGAHRALAPWEVWASVAHTWLVAGWPVKDFGTLAEAGHRQP